MNLRLEREEITPRATHGRLYLDHTLLAVTLEDPPTSEKGAIPAGMYRIWLRYSPRFQMLLPEIAHVPNFTNILIHAGNRDEDTEGCVLVGNYRVDDATIAESRAALGRVLTRYRDWMDQTIEVVDVTRAVV